MPGARRARSLSPSPREPTETRRPMKTRKLDVTVSAHTSATPEQVLEAATDFSRRRAQLWPNVRAKRLKVHDSGPQWADVTEATWIVGVFWERYRYDWSES